MDNKNEKISMFAYFTGKEIERIINEESNNLKDINMYLEGLILGFRSELTKKGTIYYDLLPEYDEYFKINSFRDGNI